MYSVFIVFEWRSFVIIILQSKNSLWSKETHRCYMLLDLTFTNAMQTNTPVTNYYHSFAQIVCKPKLVHIKQRIELVHTNVKPSNSSSNTITYSYIHIIDDGPTIPEIKAKAAMKDAQDLEAKSNQSRQMYFNA